MEIEGLVEQFISDSIPPEMLSMPLPDEIADMVVERLKQEADRYWNVNPNRSLEFANRIVAIGERRNDQSQIALGLMARGDALKFLGRLREAWGVLDQAGELFKSINDEVGWARTRIGRLYLGEKLNHVSEVLVDA